MKEIQAVSQSIKQLIDDAIRMDNNNGMTNIIRASQVIKLIHEVFKKELIRYNVNPEYIHPKIGTTKGELKFFGSIKTKRQDICVVNPKIDINPEILINGMVDPYGKNYTESSLSINVRSQLSSVGKNFDAIYERTYAESLNLHLRCPRMVLGEIFMLPVREYLSDKNNGIYDHNINHIQKRIEKYVAYYNQLNNRQVIDGDFHMYEKICLLLIDFSLDVPKIYVSKDELIQDGLLSSDSTVEIENLSPVGFIKNLLEIYIDRFDDSIFLN